MREFAVAIVLSALVVGGTLLLPYSVGTAPLPQTAAVHEGTPPTTIHPGVQQAAPPPPAPSAPVPSTPAAAAPSAPAAPAPSTPAAPAPQRQAQSTAQPVAVGG